MTSFFSSALKHLFPPLFPRCCVCTCVPQAASARQIADLQAEKSALQEEMTDLREVSCALLAIMSTGLQQHCQSVLFAAERAEVAG